MDFNDLGLGPKVLRAVSEAGYASPTPIQQQAIPEALVGKDVLGIAQTGTGKTASFTLPMIDRLSKGRARARMPRSLILAPTRELAAQVAENFETYGKYHKLNMALLIGGVSFGDQDAKLTRGVDVLIATPGRLLDHFERGKLLLTGIEIMVVDEADRMLDMGFIPDIERIFKLTPFTRQTLFFSATMPPEIQRITNQFLQSPVRIEVARQSTTADTVEQLVCRIGADNFKLKREALRQLIDRAEIQNGIIFCNRKRDVDIVTKSLRKHGYDAAAIHGDLPQSYRTQTLEQFRGGELKLLVASDVAARGLDIPSVGHVFNFDVPIHAEDYVHRIGRTGRAGRSGAAFTLASPGDSKYLGAIHELIGREIASEELTDLETPLEDDRPRRGGRGRSGGRRGEREAADKAAASPAELETSQPDIAPTEEKSEEQRPGPRRRQRRGGGSGGEDRRSAPVIGLGDHVPAFLKRPAPKVASRRPDSEIRPSADEDRLAS